MQVLKENVLPNPDKAIIVSQWPTLLKLVAIHLQREHVPYEQLDGSVPVQKRTDLVNNFNSSKHNSKVMYSSTPQFVKCRLFWLEHMQIVGAQFLL